MIASALRDLIRREKWRLRSLKTLVLPLRKMKRGIVKFSRALRGKPTLRIERSTIAYLESHLSGSVTKLHSAEHVIALPPPFPQSISDAESNLAEPAYLFELRDIDFWARYGGSVATPDGALLADLSPEVWGVENHPIFSTFRLPWARSLDGRTAILITPEARGNYYHWLVDLLPRALLLRTASGGFQGFDRILINGSHASYEEHSLRAAGVPLNKLVYVDSRDRFQIAQAVIPSMDHSSKIVAPWKIRDLHCVADAIREVDPGLRRSGPAAKKIYVSRKRAAVRRLLNEEALIPLFEKAGFTVIELELLPWVEQMRLFSNAEIILTPHGAALANIAFCRPGTMVAEIGTRAGYLDFYLHLAASAQLRYHFLEAHPRSPVRRDSLRAYENEDMIIDGADLKNFLREL